MPELKAMKTRTTSLAVRLAAWLLKGGRATGDDRSLLMAAIMENIGTLPTKKIITYDLTGRIAINGKLLTAEQSVSFRESVVSLQKNYARKVLRDQVAFLAVEMGVHQGLNQEMIQFSKAALWQIGQENELIATISELPQP